MNSKMSLERLLRWAWPGRNPDDTDAADVGTAFGMELSMEAQAQAAFEAKAPSAAQTRPGPRDSGGED